MNNLLIVATIVVSFTLLFAMLYYTSIARNTDSALDDDTVIEYFNNDLDFTSEDNNAIINNMLQYIDTSRKFANKIAIVGNGTITDSDRELINNCGLIIRFNHMTRLNPDDEIDILISRKYISNYLGINDGKMNPLLKGKQLKCIYLMDGNVSGENIARETFNTPIYSIESVKIKGIDKEPSTGMSFILYMLKYIQNKDIEVFGFNLNGTHYHDYENEKKVFYKNVCNSNEGLQCFNLHRTATEEY